MNYLRLIQEKLMETLLYGKCKTAFHAGRERRTATDDEGTRMWPKWPGKRESESERDHLQKCFEFKKKLVI